MARRGWFAIALVLALAGCATVAVPPSHLSDGEKDAARLRQTEGLWAATGLYPDQRPANPRVTVVSLDDWAAAYVKCMNNAGFSGYKLSPEGGFTILGEQSDGEKSELERLTIYLCTMSFEVEGQYDGWYNAEEVDYLYDYYRKSLVPCLASHGFEVSSVPTRGEFADGMGSWHPYYAMHDDARLQLFSDRRILVECPPTPVGIPDPGYHTYFER